MCCSIVELILLEKYGSNNKGPVVGSGRPRAVDVSRVDSCFRVTVTRNFCVDVRRRANHTFLTRRHVSLYQKSRR